MAVRVRPFNEREAGTACCVDMVSSLSNLSHDVYTFILIVERGNDKADTSSNAR